MQKCMLRIDEDNSFLNMIHFWVSTSELQFMNSKIIYNFQIPVMYNLFSVPSIDFDPTSSAPTSSSSTLYY